MKNEQMILVGAVAFAAFLIAQKKGLIRPAAPKVMPTSYSRPYEVEAFGPSEGWESPQEILDGYSNMGTLFDTKPEDVLYPATYKPWVL